MLSKLMRPAIAAVALSVMVPGAAMSQIAGLEIPTGEPIVYDLAADLSVERRYYLSEEPA